MLKKILMGLGVALLLFVLYVIYALFIATPVSPPDTASFSGQGIDIEVNYSQPSKKGRVIFGDESEGALQPYGKYWRLGANAATEISLSKDVLFAGKPLKAGTYRMYAVPGKQAFKLTLNSELDVFFGVAEPDPSLDIMTVDAPVTMQDNVTETFTVSFQDSGSEIQMHFTWDKVRFTVPIVVQ